MFVYHSDCLDVAGDPANVAISYRRAKSVLILLVIAVFAIKPVLIAMKSDNSYLHLIAALIVMVSIYAGLALALDRTTIKASGRRLQMQHGPLPFLRGLKLESCDIKTFHCDERRFRAAHYYKLEAEMLDGRRVKLLSPIPQVDDAQYVLMVLQKWLDAQAS